MYLTLPREVLAESIGDVTYADRPRMRLSRSVPDPQSLEAAVRSLTAARRPILVTRSAGRQAAVPHLVRLAERLGIAIFEPGRRT